MKKVLMIGQIWPHHIAAGNCIHAVAKYLPAFDWQPVVLTTPLPEEHDLSYQVLEVPHSDWLKDLLRRVGFDTGSSVKKQVSRKLNVTGKKSFLDYIFLRLNEVLTYPEASKGWKSPAIEAGKELMETGDIKAIITDCPPVTGLLVARELKRKYKVPWIAYFSHLWSQNNGYPYSSWRRRFDRRLELKTLSHVDVMITHSEPIAAKQRELHKGKTVLTVFEGFDPETVNSPPDKLTDKFTITYTGSFAPGLREPGMLFEALQNLLSSGVLERDRVEVRFYGPEEIWIDREIQECGLSEIARQYGRIPMTVAQAKQRESQVLFNPKWDDPEEPGIYSGKLFEFLAARRPVLATGKYRDVVDDLLSETGVGVSTSSREETERVLGKMYQEYRENGEVVFRGDASKLDRSSHREAAETFAEVLDRLI